MPSPASATLSLLANYALNYCKQFVYNPHMTSAGLVVLEPEVVSSAVVPTFSREDLEDVVVRFLDRRKATTLRTYSQALEDFRAFVGAETPLDAARALLANGHGPANALADRYRKDLLRRTLSSSTVNLRLAALRSLVKIARTSGLVAWSLEVEGERAETYRDTAGPGLDGIARILQALEGRTAKALRDRALVRLMYDRGLRRGEALGLDLEDLELDGSRARLRVLRKGKHGNEPLTIPAKTADALRDWLRVRPEVVDKEGRRPVFVGLDRAGNSKGRLTGQAVHALVRRLGEKAGVSGLRPHAFRHASITRVLDLTNGNVREARKFSGHAKVEVLMAYDDNRADVGGDLSALLAQEV